MHPLLGIETDVLEFAQKAGVVGLLAVGVVVLWRRREDERAKRDVDRDAQLADAQAVEKEYVEARVRWTATIATMAENNKDMAELQKEMLDELRAVRQHLNDHEARCTGRRATGGD